MVFLPILTAVALLTVISFSTACGGDSDGGRVEPALEGEITLEDEPQGAEPTLEDEPQGVEPTLEDEPQGDELTLANYFQLFEGLDADADRKTDKLATKSMEELEQRLRQ